MPNDQLLPNCFLLLDLDPDRPWNQTLYEAHLKEKRNRWSLDAMRGMGSLKDTAKYQLGLIPEIQAIMENEASREKVADAARSLWRELRRDRLKKFDDIRLVAECKGHVTEVQLAEWVKSFADVLTEDEIRARIQVEIRPATQPAPRPARPARLEASKARQIREKLELINEQSLYTLLNRQQTKPTTTQDYRNAANALYTKLLDERDTSALGTARKELAGEAMTIFASEDARKKYDETLTYAPVEALLDQLSEACAPDKAIAEEQAAWFVNEASKLGWDTTLAQAELEELGETKKWRLPLPPTQESLHKVVKCVLCHHINPDSREICEKCPEPLWIQCPNCHSRAAAVAAICPQCKFKLIDRFSVEWFLIECTRELDTSAGSNNANVVGAMNTLNEARRLWTPRYEDTLTRRMKELEARGSPLIQKQSTAYQLASRLMNERKFVAAREILSTLSRYTPGWEEGVKRCRSAIEKAEENVKRAQNAMKRSPVEAARGALSAMRECADIPGARELLRQIPLLPPQDVDARVSSRHVRLDWQPSPSPHAQEYVVVRGANGPVVSLGDGAVLQRQTGLSYVDPAPAVGVQLYYAVFAVWEDQSSEAAPPKVSRILLKEEASDVKCRTRRDAVEIRWTPPPHAWRIVVRRSQEGATERDELSTTISAVSRGHVVDTDVREGITYVYRIQSVFHDGQGREVWSDGVTQRATIQALPHPPRLIAELDGASFLYVTVKLDWHEQVDGDVVILVCEKRDPPAAGSQLTGEELRAFGRIITNTTPRPVPDVRHGPGSYFYVPAATVHGGEDFLVGEATPFICVKEVEELAISVDSGQARLSWCWPDACVGAMITVSALGWPGMPGARVIASPVVSRVPGDAHGQASVKLPSGDECFLMVAAQVSQTLISQGLRRRIRYTNTRARLEYQVKYSHDTQRPERLLASLHGSRTAPAFAVRHKLSTEPQNEHDGGLVVRQESMVWPKGQWEYDLRPHNLPAGAHLRLFVEDAAEARAFDVNG